MDSTADYSETIGFSLHSTKYGFIIEWRKEDW